MAKNNLRTRNYATIVYPVSAVPDLLNAFYTVASGGKIEFSALIGDMTGIDDFWQNLHDYYDTHYTQPLLQSTQGLVDIGLSGLALEGIDSIDSVNNLSIPITAQDLANFMSYDVNWTDAYANPNSITISPDAEQFQTLLDNINGSGFYFSEFNNGIPSSGQVQAGYSYFQNYYPNTYYSWFVSNSNEFGINNSTLCSCSDIQSLYITQSSGVYSFSLTVTALPAFNGYYTSDGHNLYTGQIRTDFNGQNNVIITNNSINNNGTYFKTSPHSHTFSYSGSLGQCLQYISKNIKNVNIYVDGDLWSYVGDLPTSGITLNDYINVGDTGNITYGVYPLTSVGDIGLDLAKWGEYIYNQCISGDDILTMDTVIDDGWDLVDTEDGERAITQDDEEDVAKVIHGFVGTTATTPTPTPDIGDPPILKIIPPILELPDEIWPDGGRDTTVLAQIIHSTDIIMPNDIMTILWSILGIMVIGGLLTILHK